MLQTAVRPGWPTSLALGEPPPPLPAAPPLVHVRSAVKAAVHVLRPGTCLNGSLELEPPVTLLRHCTL